MNFGKFCVQEFERFTVRTIHYLVMIGAFVLCIPTIALGKLVYEVIDPLPTDIAAYRCGRGEMSGKIGVTAAIDEYEPASFLLCNNSENEYTISFIGISFKEAQDITKPSVDVRYLKWWYQADGAWFKHWIGKGEAKLVPELLLKDPLLIKTDSRGKRNLLKVRKNGRFEYIDISNRKKKKKIYAPKLRNFDVQDSVVLEDVRLSPKTQLQYWLLVYTGSVTAGTYPGTVDLMVDGQPLRIPIEIRVLPYRLVKSEIIHSIYYRGVLSPDGAGTISSEEKSRKQLKAELENLHRHGISNPTVYQPLVPRKKWKKYTEAQLDGALNSYFAIRREVGFENRDLYYLGLTTGSVKSDKVTAFLKGALRKLSDIAGKYGFEQIYFYGSDEAKGEKLTAQKDTWRALKKEGAKIFVAGSTGHIALMGRETDLLIFRDEIGPMELKRMHDWGNRVFKYHDPKSGPENPALFRYKRGLYLWQKGFDGSMDYAYQHSMGFIWNDFDHLRYRDLAFTYPTSNGVIDTIAWEGYREGIDDLNYLATLEYQLERARSKPAVPKIVLDDTKAYLEHLRTAYSVDLDSFRKSLISRIEKLAQWVGFPEY